MVLGPRVWEERQSSFMNRDSPSFLGVARNCGVYTITLKGEASTKKWKNWRHKLWTPYLFIIPYLETPLRAR